MYPQLAEPQTQKIHLAFFMKELVFIMSSALALCAEYTKVNKTDIILDFTMHVVYTEESPAFIFTLQ